RSSRRRVRGPETGAAGGPRRHRGGGPDPVAPGPRPSTARARPRPGRARWRRAPTGSDATPGRAATGDGRAVVAREWDRTPGRGAAGTGTRRHPARHRGRAGAPRRAVRGSRAAGFPHARRAPAQEGDGGGADGAVHEVPPLHRRGDGAAGRRAPGTRPRALRAPAAPPARAGRLLPLPRCRPEEQRLRGPELRRHPELPGMPQAPEREPGLPDMSSLPPARSPVTAEPAPARPPAQVRCRLRPGVTLTFTLKSDESLVGRDSGLAVAIPLDGVSRQHARIYWDGRAYRLEDPKSTNGTLLNGRRILRDRLRHLDVITLGKTAEVIFVMRAVERG